MECIVCNKPFVPHRPQCVCCSKRCSAKNWARVKREERAVGRKARQCSECSAPFESNLKLTCGPECAKVRKRRVDEARMLPVQNEANAGLTLDEIAEQVWARKATPDYGRPAAENRDGGCGGLGMSDPSIPFGATLNPQRGFFHKVYKKPACRTCTLPFETHVPNQKDCHECVAERVRQELLRSTI